MSGRRLTRRQIERIRDSQAQRRERARDRAGDAAEALLEGDLEPPQAGRVVANHGASLIVAAADASLHRCLVRQNLGALACGDHVLWQAARSGDGVVVAVEPRRSLLSRPDYGGRLKPVAANLDQVAVVIAVAPDFNEFLIDRYLVAIALIGVEPLIVVNKIDLLDDAGRERVDARLATYRRIGYTVLPASTRASHGLDALRARLGSHTSILVGQSGVGKSSLVQALLPDLDIQTRALSAATGHGTHTTTTTMLYHLPGGGELIDSPGVRSFELAEVSPGELERGFVEFAPYLGRCRFGDCSHRVEPGCALLAAVAEGAVDPRRLAAFHQIRDSLAAR